MLGSFAVLLWPILALVALLLFRKQLRDLLSRIRKGGGVEFYPSPQPAEPSPDILPGADGSATNVPFPRTPATRAMEDFIRSLPSIASTPEPRDREQVVITLAARALLIGIFEQVEASIWASQIALLSHLHVTSNGASRDDLQRYFYQPAASRYATVFATYNLDDYLRFLVNFGLVVVTEGRASITDRGREYILWRLEMRKAPKTFG